MEEASARTAILARVRQAIRAGAPPPADLEARADAYLQARSGGPRPADSGWELGTRFRACAEALSSTVDEVNSMDGVAAAAAAYLRAQGLPQQAVCWPELAALPWSEQGLAVEARSARRDDLVGITGAFCAVADTGTLMLLSGAATAAVTSLLPETHVAVLPVRRIVAFMEDAWLLLRRERGRLPRAVNFVSGPSRTADIEQTVTLGAHGPYRVHVILVNGE